jgi:hypothetical protein
MSVRFNGTRRRRRRDRHPRNEYSSIRKNKPKSFFQAGCWLAFQQSSIISLHMCMCTSASRQPAGQWVGGGRRNKVSARGFDAEARRWTSRGKCLAEKSRRSYPSVVQYFGPLSCVDAVALAPSTRLLACSRLDRLLTPSA